MNSSSRRPESCEHRRPGPRLARAIEVCGLATQIAGPQATGACVVDRTICEACCRHELPAGARLNPIVASLVLAAVEQNGRTDSRRALAQVANYQTQQFAIRWLAASGELPREDRGEPAGNTPLRMRGRHEQGNALRIGLVGRNSRFGLGHQNRDIATQLGVDRWLVTQIPGGNDPAPQDFACRVDMASEAMDRAAIEAWLDGLDVVTFVEEPILQLLPAVARQCGVRVVCIPNWEWLHPGLPWLDDVDLMLCPTRHTAGLLAEWKSSFRFEWRMECIAWPIDTERFAFRRREVCRRFVFINGGGGAWTGSPSGRERRLRRKGFDALSAAARMAPEISIIAYSQTDDVPVLPRNVELRPPPADNRILYQEGDVCVQPSHWEGLGLPLLECQAAGMPLITTNAPPMNEHWPLAVIPAELEAAYLSSEHCIAAARIEPQQLAGVLRSVAGRDISAASMEARQFVEREHSWSAARPRILETLADLVHAESGS